MQKNTPPRLPSSDWSRPTAAKRLLYRWGDLRQRLVFRNRDGVALAIDCQRGSWRSRGDTYAGKNLQDST